ncbi:hypothetical protein [Sphingobacterium suaedae]|uniref:Uncharacterized protein n=1 Tax=Sphingobacterium suaedae TaxID=1686402 RepID=A0ABW5KEU2_9SPHI
MILNFKTIFKSAFSVAVLSATLLTTSCDKEKDNTALEFNQARATATFSVIGEWWDPSDAANWPNIYVNISGAGAQSLSSSATHQIILGSHVNGNISAGSAFTIRYIDKAYTAVVASDWSSATPVGTLGRNTTSQVGWYTYNTTTRANEPVAGRTVLVGNSTGAVYAVKLNGFANVGQQGTPGVDLEVKADINIEFKAL